MEPYINISKKQKGANCVLKIEGVLDYATTASFHNEMEQIGADMKKVIIDLSEVTFIDSTGIGAIINLSHTAAEQHFRMELVGVKEEMMEIFDTVGLFQILEALQLEEDGSV